MCTGTFHEDGRPSAGTPCTEECTKKAGRWGASWCRTAGGNWGAECVACDKGWLLESIIMCEPLHDASHVLAFACIDCDVMEVCYRMLLAY